MLTNAIIRSARPKPRAYKLFDGGGLHLFVAPTGLKSWRLKYRRGRREQLLTIGQYPDVALEAARARRDQARAAIAVGEDPARSADNVAAELADELAPPAAPVHHPAATTAAEARAAYAAIAAAPARPIATLAARFLALTAVRVGSLRLATWDEIEVDDASALVWRIPAAHLKLSRARKASAEHDHFVPLSTAAAAVLDAARNHSAGAGKLIFPIGERAIGALHDRAGLAGRHVPHGWRASFSTILNDARPEDRAAIDEALAHQVKGKVEGAYNRSAQLVRRRALFEAWAAILAG